MILEIIIIFIVFSILGWCFEYVVFNKTNYYNLTKEWFGLDLPILPIYGFGAVILYIIQKTFYGYSIWVRTFIAFVLINGLECVGGCLSYQINKYQSWRYDSDNDIVLCNGYISLRTGIAWAILSLIAFAVMDKFHI